MAFGTKNTFNNLSILYSVSLITPAIFTPYNIMKTNINQWHTRRVFLCLFGSYTENSGGKLHAR